MVLDTEPHRYKRLISDLTGYDFPPHNDNPEKVIEIVRNWLNRTKSKTIKGHTFHQKRYREFLTDLPALCKAIHCEPDTLEFLDYYALVTEWLKKKDEEIATREYSE